MSKSFYDAVKDRRSYYCISNEAVISDERLKEIVDYSVTHVPYAFNAQSGRVVILLGKNHTKLWDITMNALKAIVPADNFGDTKNKIDSFNNGYGTLLFFEDTAIVKDLQVKFELYKDNFPVWSEQSSGMLQYTIWTSLESEGYGASLQHYGELIADEVKREWNIPDTWRLVSQMPFGKPTEEPKAKEPMDLNGRVIVHK